VDLRDYTRLLRRRWRLIALCLLLGLGASAALTYSAHKEYTAKTQLFVSARDSAASASDINSAYTGGLFTQQRVKSYTSVLGSQHVADLVRADLGLSETASAIAGKISASAPLDTVLLNVSVTDSDPARAQSIANSIGRIFPHLVDSIEAPANGGASPIKVSVVQAAQLPTAPTSPKPKLNLALGLLIGLAVGVGAAVARETLDASVKGPEHAAELTETPVIGAITFDTDATKHPLVMVASPNSPRAEAFRQLRTNLQFVDIEHPLRSVVITSSVSEEGKSTTTCNLAIALAEAGLSVVLVEADLRRPRVADYMGLEGAVGLTSVLLGRVDLDAALQAWGTGGLHVLASGPLPPNPSELLGSAGMQQLLHELEDRADIVLIDAPPLLPVTDAAVLGTITSGVVLLIRSNKTRREQVTRAMAILRGVSATPLGTILNMVPTRGPDAYAYGYGYGYGYKAKTKATTSVGRITADDADEAVVAGSPRFHAEEPAGPAHERPTGDPAPPAVARARPQKPQERRAISGADGDQDAWWDARERRG
jgi:capsular exopolysaccharide synthesis family protein